MGVFVGLGHGSGYSVEMFDPRVGRWMFEGLLPPIPVSGIHPDERSYGAPPPPPPPLLPRLSCVQAIIE